MVWVRGFARVSFRDTSPNCIHANSPGLSGSLPDTTPISTIKSSYELFCALIWNLCHFEFSFTHSLVSGTFLHVFHHGQRLSCHYNHKSELWCSVTRVSLHNYNVLKHLGTGSNITYQGWGGGGGARERVSRFLISRGWQLCNCLVTVLLQFQ